jgi:hypothetical protein
LQTWIVCEVQIGRCADHFAKHGLEVRAARAVAGTVVASTTSHGTITRPAATSALPISCSGLAAGRLLSSSFWFSAESGRAVVSVIGRLRPGA